MVGFARDEIEERSRLGFCDMPFLASSYRPFFSSFSSNRRVTKCRNGSLHVRSVIGPSHT
jgi:hypothetical protein